MLVITEHFDDHVGNQSGFMRSGFRYRLSLSIPKIGAEDHVVTDTKFFYVDIVQYHNLVNLGHGRDVRCHEEPMTVLWCSRHH